MPAPPLTVIVPTRNSAATIDDCLRGILALSPEATRQIVVIDNGSTDDTVERVQRYPVTLERVPPGFVSLSRNRAVEIAAHDLVAFVDSDCVVQSDWHEALAAVLAAPGVGAAGCRYSLREHPTWVEHAWHEAHRRRSPDVQSPVRYLPGGNLAMSRALFRQVGGFPADLETGEDVDLCKRVILAGRSVIESSTIRCVHLGEPRTLRAVYRRNRWHGRGARFRYTDGRFSPTLVSTLVFAATLAAAIVGLALAAFTRSPLWLITLATPFFVPGLYALRYMQPPRLLHGARLVLVYGAYFLGRARALPVVAHRAWERRRDQASALGPPNSRATRVDQTDT